MVNPHDRVALIITFIQGKDVQDWVENELNLLEQRVTNRHATTEEYLWTEFEKAFKDAFKDTGKELNTQTELTDLKQKKNEVERYTVTFNRLLQQAGFDEDDKGSVNMYKNGLSQELHEACLHHKPMPTTMSEWQKVARQEQLIFREIQHYRFQRDHGRHTLPTQKVKGPPPTPKYWKAPGPNAMNVDLADSTPETRTCYNCQKQGHLAAHCRSPKKARTTQTTAKGTCNYCKKPGHFTNECYALKRKKEQETRQPAHNRATETQSTQDDEQILLTPNNFRGMMLNLPDEERASVIEEMLSQDFSGETN